MDCCGLLYQIRRLKKRNPVKRPVYRAGQLKKTGALGDSWRAKSRWQVVWLNFLKGAARNRLKYKRKRVRLSPAPSGRNFKAPPAFSKSLKCSGVHKFYLPESARVKKNGGHCQLHIHRPKYHIRFAALYIIGFYLVLITENGGRLFIPGGQFK